MLDHHPGLARPCKSKEALVCCVVCSETFVHAITCLACCGISLPGACSTLASRVCLWRCNSPVLLLLLLLQEVMEQFKRVLERFMPQEGSEDGEAAEAGGEGAAAATAAGDKAEAAGPHSDADSDDEEGECCSSHLTAVALKSCTCPVMPMAMANAGSWCSRWLQTC